MVSGSSRCPTCGDTCPPDAAFCISWGASLAQPATSTTRLLKPASTPRPLLRLQRLVRPHKSRCQLPVVGVVAAFGRALLALLLLVTYVGSHRPGLSTSSCTSRTARHGPQYFRLAPGLRPFGERQRRRDRRGHDPGQGRRGRGAGRAHRVLVRRPLQRLPHPAPGLLHPHAAARFRLEPLPPRPGRSMRRQTARTRREVEGPAASQRRHAISNSSWETPSTTRASRSTP